MATKGPPSNASGAGADTEQSTATQPISSGTVRRAQRDVGQRRIALVVYHRDGAEVAVLRPGVAQVVGRSRPSHVRIADVTLSREHARFTLAGDRVVVEDLSSTNGTRIAGERIQRAELGVGEEVLLGGLVACVHALGSAEEDPGMAGEEVLRGHLEKEVASARRSGQRLAVLTVRAAARTHVSRWSRRVRALLRPADRMGLYSADTVQVIVPDTNAGAALKLAGTIAARTEERDAPLLVGLAVYPDAATTAEVLITRSRDALGRASPERPVQVAGTAPRVLGEAQAGEEPFVTGARMREVLATAARFAAARMPVILHGETGVGKEVLARLLHEQGPRRGKPLVCVNCAAIPAQLVESTLFGHEKGAFTGATEQHKGVLEAASSGTVLLDEVGELPLAAQAALLRVLETGRLNRVGSSREIEVDVRVVAATHRDLEAMCAEGRFREDLYFRLNGTTLVIPPLRERADEIEPLARRFLQKANEDNQREVRGIGREALALLERYDWPGNVRELKNAIERAVVITEAELIRAVDLPARVRAGEGRAGRLVATEEKMVAAPSGDGGGVRTQVQQYEARIILDALVAARWNQTEAARRLGIPLRTLVHKIKTLGLKKSGR